MITVELDFERRRARFRCDRCNEHGPWQTGIGRFNYAECAVGDAHHHHERVCPCPTPHLTVVK